MCRNAERAHPHGRARLSLVGTSPTRRKKFRRVSFRLSGRVSFSLSGLSAGTWERPISGATPA